jgi:hypothetical protein
MQITNFKDMYVAELQELVSWKGSSQTRYTGWPRWRCIRL